MKKLYAFLCLVMMASGVSSLFANNLNITNVSLTGATSTTIQVQYNMFWENSWRDAEHWDATWVFIKFSTNNGNTWAHATLSASGHVAGTASPTPTLQIPQDNLGAFVYRSTQSTGTFTITGQQLQWNFVANGLNQSQASSAEIRVFGIEMVYIPQGSYALGDGVNYSGTPSPSTGAFRRNFTNRAVYITDQVSDSINDNVSGLFFRADGDNGIDLNNDGLIGTWPTDAPAFPTGFTHFYCMKYELTQGQYVDFLNTLTYTQQTARVQNATNIVAQNAWDGTTTVLPTHRYNIFVQTAGTNSTVPRVYTATRPDRACNHIAWPDAAAYSDWSGLRPMTEMEFEKACRGPLPPVQGEFAWGNASSTGNLTALITGAENGQETSNVTTSVYHRFYTASVTGGDGSFTTGAVRVGMFARANTTRAQSGLTYWGLADMTGNVGEWMVGFFNLAGRSFTGLHGNGTLMAAGHADVSFWPGINGNTTLTTANSAFLGSTGITASAGLATREDPCQWVNCSSIYPISSRFNLSSNFVTRNVYFGYRGVKSNL
jgi:formylglycine-generating enzyme required for sulfatase activity